MTKPNDPATPPHEVLLGETQDGIGVVRGGPPLDDEDEEAGVPVEVIQALSVPTAPYFQSRVRRGIERTVTTRDVAEMTALGPAVVLREWLSAFFAVVGGTGEGTTPAAPGPAPPTPGPRTPTLGTPDEPESQP